MILLWMLPNVSRAERFDFTSLGHTGPVAFSFYRAMDDATYCLKAAAIFSLESRRILHDAYREIDQKGRKL